MLFRKSILVSAAKPAAASKPAFFNGRRDSPFSPETLSQLPRELSSMLKNMGWNVTRDHIFALRQVHRAHGASATTMLLQSFATNECTDGERVKLFLRRALRDSELSQAFKKFNARANSLPSTAFLRLGDVRPEPGPSAVDVPDRAWDELLSQVDADRPPPPLFSNELFERAPGQPRGRDGRRVFSFPSLPLHKQQASWLPLEERVFARLRPQAPEPCAYVPPLDGDAPAPLALAAPAAPPLPSFSPPKDRLVAQRPQRVFSSAETQPALRGEGRGTRKTARAVAVVTRCLGESAFTVNGVPLQQYFVNWLARDVALQPLVICEGLDTLSVEARVQGGGESGQAEALRMAVSRAMVAVEPAWRVPLKMAGYLSRDPRMVERKKAGFKKARKRKQWVKR